MMYLGAREKPTSYGAVNLAKSVAILDQAYFWCADSSPERVNSDNEEFPPSIYRSFSTQEAEYYRI